MVAAWVVVGGQGMVVGEMAVAGAVGVVSVQGGCEALVLKVTRDAESRLAVPYMVESTWVLGRPRLMAGPGIDFMCQQREAGVCSRRWRPSVKRPHGLNCVLTLLLVCESDLVLSVRTSSANHMPFVPWDGIRRALTRGTIRVTATVHAKVEGR